MPDVQEILTLIKDPSKEDVALIKKAYDFSANAHEGETRFTGEPYFVHAFEAGKNLAEFGMDAPSIAAGLLHDTLEDGDTDEKTLEKEFGKEIAFLVEGVTKLGKLKYRGMERHAESLRKLFVATAKDPRVLIIKLADRLHNVKTLAGHPEEAKRHRIAMETLEIYAPLADRLGMGLLKGYLEDYSFPHLYPEEYKQVNELMTRKRDDHMKYLEKFHRSLQKELAAHNIKDVKTSYRVKHIYSLWRKLERKEMDIDKIYDITALRVTTNTVEQCYQILGIIHGAWRPLPGRIKDYIALPKPNGYQSIHTTVFTGDGGIVEVQIRTEKMHKEAEYGIASHLAYKGGFFDRIHNPQEHNQVKKKLHWIHELIQWQEQVSENKEFLKELKMDFFKHRVFVFTPKGDAIDLPEESTAVDFAYMIHSDIGNHMAGAKVNGKMVSLSTKLHNGDIVEIIAKKNAHPSQKWLDYVKTSMAQRHIRLWLQKNQPQ
jgi:guanosine-3',5'-bis(diphosphate) 3'-pyrophosphohydrolase